MNTANFDFLVKLYFQRINEVGFDYYVKKDEGYKFDFVNHFQNNFDINATNFHDILDASLLNNNITGGRFFYPKQTLLDFSKKDEEKVRNAFIDLFDRNNLIADRIDNFKQVFDTLMAEENKKNNSNLHTFIDVRFISLLLAVMYPNDYYYIMNTSFKRVGKYLDSNFYIPNSASAGEKYNMFAQIADQVKDIIIKLQEIQEVHDAYINRNNRNPYPKMFKDDKYCWTTQDFIWIVGKKLDNSRDPVSDPAL
jgi:hypothetical protein